MLVDQGEVFGFKEAFGVLHVGGALEHVWGIVGGWRFGGLGVWRLEHWRYISAHLEVVSVDSRVCNA